MDINICEDKNYGAGFQRVGDEMYPWYTGGKIALKKERFILSFLWLKKLEVSYREILKVSIERYCLKKCIKVQFADGLVYIGVASWNLEEVLEQLQKRVDAAWDLK